jgi:hypothetical protein
MGRRWVAHAVCLWAAFGCAPASSGGAAGACAPAAGAAQPRSIGDVVQLLNAASKPVDLPCALALIPGALQIAASTSTASLQPALGSRSPRIFLLLDPLVATVVPEGAGAALMELGQRDGDALSIKGELQFPVTAELPPSGPFDHALFSDTVTTCAFCHAGETPAPQAGFADAFESQAFRPAPSTAVGVDELRAEREACDPATEPYRCGMLGALFDRAAVTAGDFPAGYVTFQ